MSMEDARTNDLVNLIDEEGAVGVLQVKTMYDGDIVWEHVSTFECEDIKTLMKILAEYRSGVGNDEYRMMLLKTVAL